MKIARLIIVLTLIGVISGTILAMVYNWTYPKIVANQIKETDAAVFEVVPSTKSYKKITSGDLVYFECYDQSKRNAGYAILCQGNGYQGQIKFMIGTNADMTKFTGMKMLEQLETPGLGARIAEKWFQEQFKGLVTKPPIEYVKGKPSKDYEIEAITGATISSRAVVNIINKTVLELMQVK